MFGSFFPALAARIRVNLWSRYLIRNPKIILLSHTDPNWATPHSAEVRWTLLIYAAPRSATPHPPYWATPHPAKLLRTLLCYRAWIEPTQIAFSSSFPNNRVATICPKLCPCALSCLLFPSSLCRLFDCFLCVSGFWFSRLAHLSPHYLCFRLSESSPSLSLFFSVSVPASAILF